MISHCSHNSGDFRNWVELKQSQFTTAQLRTAKKDIPYDGKRIWDKGHKVKREMLNNWLVTFGKVLKFNTFKAAVDPQAEGEEAKEDANQVDIEIESGGAYDIMLERVQRRQDC